MFAKVNMDCTVHGLHFTFKNINLGKASTQVQPTLFISYVRIALVDNSDKNVKITFLNDSEPSFTPTAYSHPRSHARKHASDWRSCLCAQPFENRKRAVSNGFGPKLWKRQPASRSEIYALCTSWDTFSSGFPWSTARRFNAFWWQVPDNTRAGLFRRKCGQLWT